MIKFLAGIVAGVIAHQSNDMFKSWEKSNGRAWVLIGRYSLGMLVVLFVQWLMSPKDSRDEIAQAGIVAAVSVGVGVATGYVIDDLPRQRERPPQATLPTSHSTRL